jgi:hypothetical protein
MSGHAVVTKKVVGKGQEHELDVAILPSGYYIMNVVSGSYSKKVKVRKK